MHSLLHDLKPLGPAPEQMNIRPPCLPEWSHCGVPTNVIPSCTWLYLMHCTHQPCKQIWDCPLPNGHLVWQLKEGHPRLLLQPYFGQVWG
jgi:hypothetical protein